MLLKTMMAINHSNIFTHKMSNKVELSNLSLLNSALAADFCSGVVEGVASNLKTDTGSFVFLCVPEYSLNTDLGEFRERNLSAFSCHGNTV